MSIQQTTRRLLALVRARRLDRELDGEIIAHIELAERDGLARGLSPEEARLAARRSFGAIEPMKEHHRDARSARWLETLWRDVRFGLRMLWRTPAFCASAILILGISIGANTTMFSAIKAILLQPLAYAKPDELVVILHDGRSPVNAANFLDWRDQSRSFAQMGAAEYWTPNLGAADRSERILGLHVTHDILALLGVAPLHGRVFTPDDDAPGNDRRVVIGYGLWQRSFSGDPGVIGRDVRLDGEPYTIVGVMPRDFAFAPFWAVGAELWAPMPLADRRGGPRSGNSLRLFARLAPGVTVAQAQADISAITARLEQQFPGSNRNVVVMPLKEKVVGSTRLALVVLLVSVGFVLLIACANVAHMLLARAAARQKEVAVRLALGASRLQIVRQFLVESLLLAGLSGAVGLALAVWGVRLLSALAPPDLPRVDRMAIDGQALAFTLGLSMLTGVIFGLVPAWQAARPAVGDHLKGRGTTAHRHQARLRDLLMASELALALMLLIGAGLMVRSLAALQAIDAGFDPRGVLSMVVSIKGTPHDAPGRRPAFFTAVVDQLRALPGVQAASAINHLPVDGDLWDRMFTIGGRPTPRSENRPAAIYRVVLPDYFKTMRLPLVRGRDVTPRDDHNAPAVVIINERLARRWFAGEDPIGQRITLDDTTRTADPRWMTIIGIAKDAVQKSWQAAPASEIYLPYLQTTQYLQSPEGRWTMLTMVLRTGGDPAALAPSARSAVWSLDSGVSVSDVLTMESAIGEALARPRFQFTLLGLFAGVALLLAAAGIYSVMSYAISRRTQEIGLRLTLGAQRGDVLRLILRQAMVRVAMGAAIGLTGALLLTRLMSTLLYHVRPTDPLTFGLVSLVLIAAALVASYVPARRAARIDPIVALRQE